MTAQAVLAEERQDVLFELEEPGRRARSGFLRPGQGENSAGKPAADNAGDEASQAPGRLS